MAQDHGFCRGQVEAHLAGVMEEAVLRKPGIEQDRVLLLPGKDPDKAGEAMLCKEQAARVNRQSTINGRCRRYKDIDIVVDEDGHFHPVCR